MRKSVISALFAAALALPLSFEAFAAARHYGALPIPNAMTAVRQESDEAVLLAAPFSDGSGTKEAPYLLSTADDLRLLATLISGGTEKYTDACYRLTRDIDLDGGLFEGIGSEAHPFTGHFDGASHTIKNGVLTVNGGTVGFFGVLCGGGVENLSLSDIRLSDGEAPAFTGTLIGRVAACGSDIAVEGCHVDAGTLSVLHIPGSAYCGGLIGYAEANGGRIDIRGCSAGMYADVSSDGTLGCGLLIGGTAAANGGAILVADCGTSGLLNARTNGELYLSGSVGAAHTDDAAISLIDLYADGAVCGSADTAYIAGICAAADAGDDGSIFLEDLLSRCDVFVLDASNAFGGHIIADEYGDVAYLHCFAAEENRLSLTGTLLSHEQTRGSFDRLSAYGFNERYWTRESDSSYPSLDALPRAAHTPEIGCVSDGILYETTAFGYNYMIETASFTPPSDARYVSRGFSTEPYRTAQTDEYVFLQKDTLLFSLPSDQPNEFLITYQYFDEPLASVLAPYGAPMPDPETELPKPTDSAVLAFSHFSDEPDGEPLDLSSLTVDGDRLIYAVYHPIAANAWDGKTVTPPSRGRGTKYDPYVIANAENLAGIRELLPKLTKKSCFLLAANIDLSGEEWTPIGTEAHPFSGTFIGGDRVISHFSVHADNTACAGLFGCAEDASFEDVGVSECDIYVRGSKVYAGALVGRCRAASSDAFIRRCFVHASVHADGVSAYAGGLCGYAEADPYASLAITDNCVKGDITSEGSVNAFSGGMTGYYGSYTPGIPGFDRCVYIGNVLSTAPSSASAYAGGMTGFLFEDDVWAFGQTKASALAVSAQSGNLQNCVFSGSVSASKESVNSYAGVCGYANTAAILLNNYQTSDTVIQSRRTQTRTASMPRSMLFTEKTLSAKPFVFDFDTVWQITNGLPSLRHESRERVTLVYDADGGKNAPRALSLETGINLRLSADVPERTGYAFLGWSRTRGGSVELRPHDRLLIDDYITLYAVWEKLLAVRLHYLPNNVTTLYFPYERDVLLPEEAPTRPMYEFEGWAEDRYGKARFLPGDRLTPQGDTDLYAVWTPYVTLSFVTGKAETPKNITVKKGVGVSIPDDVPPFDGSRFLGWSPDANASAGEDDLYRGGDLFIPTGDTTLYAIGIPGTVTKTAVGTASGNTLVCRVTAENTLFGDTVIAAAYARGRLLDTAVLPAAETLTLTLHGKADTVRVYVLNARLQPCGNTETVSVTAGK